MNKALFSIGVLVSAVFLVWWVAAGTNTGWTKTSVPRIEKDPVTEIESTIWDKRFVPGIEMLVLAEVVSGALIVASFLVRRRKPSTP